MNTTDLTPILQTGTASSAYSPLALAYIGDAVYELMTRDFVIRQGATHAEKLHKKTITHVCAKAQSQAMNVLLPLLTEQETDIYKRGRNANSNHVPKNADVQDYRRATGFEALFGYLYLNGNLQRINELFTLIHPDSAL